MPIESTTSARSAQASGRSVSVPVRLVARSPHGESIKGRGTALRVQGRFESTVREAVDDGWVGSGEDAVPRPDTTVVEEQARSIVSRNRSPDIFFNLSVNPYRGCEHGCIYCYARPNHAYLGLSPGLDFETRLFAKVNAAPLLRKALSAPGYQCEPINIGSVTDAYQPIERQYRITRSVLEVMAEFRQPALLITKSSLIERDIDLLGPMARDGLVSACVTVTTLDADLARRMEPRAGAPWRRVETIRRLASAGIPVSVSIGPLIPFINDHEIESLLEACRAAGARSSFHTVVRLPNELSPLFRQWLEAHFPERAARVMARIQEMRGGRDNDPDFFSRMRGRGVYADLIRMRFAQASRRLGLDHDRPALRTDLFTPTRTTRDVGNPKFRPSDTRHPTSGLSADLSARGASGAGSAGMQLSLL